MTAAVAATLAVADRSAYPTIWPSRAPCWRPRRPACRRWPPAWTTASRARSNCWRRATGRVVVSGMGKSGHVGRKIAATLASTGTPALFVHPAEASHGDLGMIVPGDAVLALSNSGETAELADLVAHARRFGLPLVAITARAEFDAGAGRRRRADCCRRAAEACPMGLAPTTSTTMQMALGDALAVALLTRRGFTAADFRQFHPGGRLGARLRRVRDLMHTGDAVPLAPPGHCRWTARCC